MPCCRDLWILGYLSITTVACSRAADAPALAASAAPTAIASAEAPPDLTAVQRRALIDAILPKIQTRYVFPDVGAKMSDALREHAAHGDYDAITREEDLAKVVTEDLRAVSHDRHMMLEYLPGPKPRATPAERAADAARTARFGFGVIERLPGDVAHLVIESFEPLNSAVTAAVATNMTQIADASVLVIDLRENHGGDPATVALVLSYLFDAAPVHINDMFWHDDGTTQQFWTRRDVDGKRFGAKKPVYVLTSKGTFSAGEEAAYDLKALKRAVIVGEATAGGAHPVAPLKLDEHLSLRVPVGRAINPITHADWEGTGVVPDVDVDSPAALHEAQVRSLKTRIDALPPGASRTELEKALTGLR